MGKKESELVDLKIYIKPEDNGCLSLIHILNGRIDSGLGQIVIDTDVIATYAGSVAVECFGIVGMAAVSMTVSYTHLYGSQKYGTSSNRRKNHHSGWLRI